MKTSYCFLIFNKCFLHVFSFTCSFEVPTLQALADIAKDGSQRSSAQAHNVANASTLVSWSNYLMGNVDSFFDRHLFIFSDCYWNVVLIWHCHGPGVAERWWGMAGVARGSQFNTRRTDVRCFLYSLHLPSIECQKLKLPMHTKVLCTALSRNVGNQDTLWQRGWGLFASSTDTLASFQSDAISPALLLQEELEFDAWKECLEQACQTQKMVSVSVSCVMKCP